MRYLVLAVLGVLATAVGPQAEPGSIEGQVTRPGSEAIAGVQIVAEGPISMTLGGRYTPNPALTPEMQAEIEQLIISSRTPVLEQIVDAALRREALLLALPEPPRPQGQTSRTLLPQQTATSDSQGRFTFKSLAPGTYRVRAVSAGYFGLPAPGFIGNIPSEATATVVVSAAIAAETNLVMVRGGTIAGTVRGADGQPMSGVAVRPYRLGYRDTDAVLQTGTQQQADDRGRFRLFDLPPGEYLVAVPIGLAIGGARPQDRYLTTFHPAALDGRDAQRIALTEGAEVSGVDLQMQPKPVNTISGRVNNLPALDINGRPLVASTFFLLPADPARLTDGFFTHLSSAADRSNGQFELKGLTPGSYFLMSCVNDNTGRIFHGKTPINVSAGDLPGVVIDLHPAVEVRARLTVDGAAPPFTMGPPPPANRDGPRPPVDSAPVPRPSITLTLRSLESQGGLAQGGLPPACSSASGSRILQVEYDSAGIYTFPNTVAGRYTIVAAGALPLKAYIAEVRLGARSVTDGFSIEHQPVSIDVVIKTDGRSVQGTVRDSADKPFGSARVALVPDNRRENTSLYKSTVADGSGRFTLNGIAPGTYTLFAWKATPDSAWMNAEFLKPFEGRGQHVTITAESPASTRMNLRAIE